MAQGGSEPAYVAWLSEYTEKLAQMDPVALAQENHEDYRDESQVYPDYLDYVEEWKWSANQILDDLKSKMINNMAKLHQVLKCKCGERHQLALAEDPIPSGVIVDSYETPIQHECWYQTVADMVRRVKQSMRYIDHHLPDPIEHVMSEVAGWKLLDENQSPVLLPLDVFRATWWMEKDRDAMISKLRSVTSANRAKEMANMKERLTPEVRGTTVLLHYPHHDHGFHLFVTASGDRWPQIHNWMNKHRARLGEPHNRISKEEIAESMESCPLCKTNRARQAKMSIFGIYYAPPLGGKTTALNDQLIVAFDTDWIGVGMRWTDYGILFRKGIPVMTNQPEVFIGSGIKIIGVLKHEIREMDGKPLDTYERLRGWADAHKRNVLFFDAKPHEYVSDYAIQLQMFQLSQRMIENQAINIMPFYTNMADEQWIRKFPKLLRDRDKKLNQGVQDLKF